MPFDTSILDAALAQQRAERELERQQLLVRVLRLLDERAVAFGIQEAYVFGSLTIPYRFSPQSDVDIGVEQIEPTKFIEAMAEFSLVLGRDVDLVELDKCHFAHRIREKVLPYKQRS